MQRPSRRSIYETATCSIRRFQSRPGCRRRRDIFNSKHKRGHLKVSVPTGMQTPSRPLSAQSQWWANSGFSPDRDVEAVATKARFAMEWAITQFQSRPGCRRRRDAAHKFVEKLMDFWFQSRPGCRGRRDSSVCRSISRAVERFSPNRDAEAIATNSHGLTCRRF